MARFRARRRGHSLRDVPDFGGADHPIKTVGQPGAVMTPPWPATSVSRAAGIPAISTPVEPVATAPGPPAQTFMSPIRAAGIPPINTVTAPGGKIGPPTCGTTPVTAGQTTLSVTRAAGKVIMGPFHVSPTRPTAATKSVGLAGLPAPAAAGKPQPRRCVHHDAVRH